MNVKERTTITSKENHPLYDQVSCMLDKLMDFIVIYNSQKINQKERIKYNDDSTPIKLLLKNCHLDDKSKEDLKIETNERIIACFKTILDNIEKRKCGDKYVTVLKAYYMPDIKGNMQEISTSIIKARNCDEIAKNLNISKRTLFYRKKAAINMFCEELEKMNF